MIIDWQNLSEGIMLALNLNYLFFAFLGVLFGTILGMIPGLTGSVGMALLLPLSFFMEPMLVLCIFLGTYAGGLYGGSISAILLNTPGTPGAVCTALDGYPLTKKGKSFYALCVAMFSSAIGGLIGILALIILVNTFGKLVLKLGSPEMFMIVFIALSIIATIRPESMAKTLFAGFTGIMLGTIGFSTSGMSRGAMGILYLLEGIPFIPTLVGVFAISEAVFMIEKESIISEDGKKEMANQNLIQELYNGLREIIKRPFLVIKSSLTGLAIGALPAAGGSAASVVAYGEAKRVSKHPETFGKGNVEGIIAAENANNACEGGSMLTTFLLGIPGSAAGAIVLSALYLQGWVPGPRLFLDHKEIMYGLLTIMFLQQFMLILSGLIVITLTYKIVKLPSAIISPILIVISCTGVYVYRGVMFDVGLALFFGLLAYFFRKFKYPVIALILGVLLGGMVDEYLIIMGQRFAGDFLIIFKRPISLIFAILTIFSLGRAMYKDYKQGLLSLWEK